MSATSAASLLSTCATTVTKIPRGGRPVDQVAFRVPELLACPG